MGFMQVSPSPQATTGSQRSGSRQPPMGHIQNCPASHEASACLGWSSTTMAQVQPGRERGMSSWTPSAPPPPTSWTAMRPCSAAGMRGARPCIRTCQARQQLSLRAAMLEPMDPCWTIARSSGSCSSGSCGSRERLPRRLTTLESPMGLARGKQIPAEPGGRLPRTNLRRAPGSYSMTAWQLQLLWPSLPSSSSSSSSTREPAMKVPILRSCSFID